VDCGQQESFPPRGQRSIYRSRPTVGRKIAHSAQQPKFSTKIGIGHAIACWERSRCTQGHAEANLHVRPNNGGREKGEGSGGGPKGKKVPVLGEMEQSQNTVKLANNEQLSLHRYEDGVTGGG